MRTCHPERSEGSPSIDEILRFAQDDNSHLEVRQVYYCYRIKPWFLVEVKQSNNQAISPHLYDFQKQSGAKHAFQVVIDMPYVPTDCFTATHPVIVPARTFLSQLV